SIFCAGFINGAPCPICCRPTVIVEQNNAAVDKTLQDEIRGGQSWFIQVDVNVGETEFLRRHLLESAGNQTLNNPHCCRSIGQQLFDLLLAVASAIIQTHMLAILGSVHSLITCKSI